MCWIAPLICAALFALGTRARVAAIDRGSKRIENAIMSLGEIEDEEKE